ncbi:acyl-CoA dehydrogenase/oxidase C-terminal [Dacryopinax primogenitus]|uniref:Acyl-CoA dehydrogenase/oxidase C-terminal n=1 Tax=Dacryopinax primogenitus (strain DJM 731) TaxID=1858805 RepID=M5FVB9_DACPD|nr:acyl-CoA dehydrogenase/oxidase C-terminal [Dacryopinax primogenitus]EJT97266.1 acyl-CoA dehydrogenase/oxidase C-terminal [Dacryopinax primogenitus]
MKVEDSFQLEQYKLPKNVYDATRSLNALLRRILPESVRKTVEADLRRFAKRIHDGVGRLAEGPHNEPRLVQYDHYGRRVDRLETSEGWRKLKDIAAEEGIVGIAFERQTGEYARVHQFAKIYLWVGDSRVVGCPMSMTDGAARVIEKYGTPLMKSSILPLLTTRDTTHAWTAGQFMTEKPGGSDVSRTETVATRAPGQGSTIQPGDLYILDGFKWFSSATDGNVALSLARTGGPGSSGLSLFLLPLKARSFLPGSEASNNGVFVHRMKQKIGTRAVPTAELSITGAHAYLVGELGQGVRNIATVLNITRMHSAFHAVGSVGRALMIATSYAGVRKVLNTNTGEYVLLQDLPIHTSFLLDTALLHHALLHLLIPLSLFLGKSELGSSTPAEESRLRLLTPVAKAFAGQRASKSVQDCIEALGGLGYMEEEPLSRLMRDSLVERIWEGTGSVLAGDVCRVIGKSKHKAMDYYLEWAYSILASSTPHPSVSLLTAQLHTISHATHRVAKGSYDPRLPPALLAALGYTTASLSMVQQANWASQTPGEEGELEWEMLNRWLGKAGESLRELERLAVGEGQKELEVERVIVHGRAKL